MPVFNTTPRVGAPAPVVAPAAVNPPGRPSYLEPGKSYSLRTAATLAQRAGQPSVGLVPWLKVPAPPTQAQANRSALLADAPITSAASLSTMFAAANAARTRATSAAVGAPRWRY